MKKRLYFSGLFLFFFLWPSWLMATFTLSGRILDVNRVPIPYSTIYISELMSGISADSQGEFKVTIPKGKYSCIISSLGYKSSSITIDIVDDTYKEIVLEYQVYQLAEAQISSRREDRAYSIMRRAIARAPYFLNIIDSYESSIYLKGSMIITKLPKLVTITAGKQRSNLVLNNLFLLESHSTINFSSPDIYQERIEAFSSTIPAEIDVNNISAVIKGSIYENMFFERLSPLSADAFKYYRFTFLGISNQSGRVINKIRVSPKRGDSKLFNGYIYIVDDLWSVSNFEFIAKESGVTTTFTVNYLEVYPHIFMPISYKSDISVDILGIKANGGFGTSLKYSNINVKETIYNYLGLSNESPNYKPDPIRNRIASRQAKESKRSISTLIESNEVKPADSVVKETRVSRLQVKPRRSVDRVIDSLATKRDSLYWSGVRTSPLQPQEIDSYKFADSLKQEFRKFEQEDSIKRVNRSTGNRILDKVIFDNRVKVSDKSSIGYGGISKFVGDYNYVDGYLLGQSFDYRFNRLKHSTLTISPWIYYSTGQKRWNWHTNINYSYDPIRRGMFSFSIGNSSQDISNNSSISRFVNSYASFFFNNNPLKFYQKEWISLSNSVYIFHAMRLNLKIEHHRASPLINSVNKTPFGKEVKSNQFENIYVSSLEDHKSFFAVASLSYTPMHYYRVSNGVKRYLNSRYPTFTLTNISTLYTKSNYSNYGQISLTINQKMESGLYGNFDYMINGGYFYNRKKTDITDFKHFKASDIVVTESGFANSFLCVDPYLYSTNISWLQSNFNYYNSYLLINRLGFLSSPLLTEGLHFKILYLPNNGINYSEIGYSIGIKDLMNLGIFSGFKKFEFNSIGVRLEMPILKGF